MPNLYIVASPIGNLKDITLRALEILKEVDLILAEDTRVTKKLLSHYQISKPVWRYDANARESNFLKIFEFLEKGKDLALVTDAGTPGISDPGQRLIEKVSKKENVRIVPIPGPSALSTMISGSDIDLSEFTFLGFPPHKKGRKTFFSKIAKSELPVILYESPHRIQKTFKELFLATGERHINVGRELTKIYEEIWRGDLSKASDHFSGEKGRGEFVIVVSI